MGPVKSAKAQNSEESVLSKTGEPVAHWFEILNLFDVKTNGHKAAALHLRDDHGTSYWWAQQLTIMYEQEHGLREPGQRHKGLFTVNVSKTVNVGIETAFAAWSSATGWDAWFSSGAKLDFRSGGTYSNNDKDAGTFKKIRRPGEPGDNYEAGRIEFTWENPEHSPGSTVVVQFIEKGPSKTLVALTHDKLPDATGCARMKEGWSRALASLKSWLENGVRINYEDWKSGQRN